MTLMPFQLRHSHIAVRGTVRSLAVAIGAPILSGEDDLGRYRYFDLFVSDEGGKSRTIRFASHQGDEMVHLLAERVDAVGDLAAALVAVGVTNRAALSISTDRDGRPVRSADELLDWIASMSIEPKPSHGGLEIATQQNGNNPVLPRIAMHLSWH